MPIRQVQQVDVSTGECLEGCLVYVGEQYPSIYGGDWFMSNREAYKALAKDDELQGKTLKVLLYLLSRLDYENWIQVPQKEICNELGMLSPNVSTAIRTPIKKGILLKGPKVGQSYAFRLNPYYAYRGDSKKGRKWITEIIEGGKSI